MGYGDDSSFDAFLSANGYEKPGGAPSNAVLRQRGSTYVDGLYGERFPGVPTGGEAQERAWPRTGATIYGSALATDLVPNRVIEASYFAAYFEATSPGSLAVIIDPAKRLKKQKIGPIEREFFETGEGAAFASFAPISSIIEGLLAPLLVPEPAGIGIWVV